MGSVHEQTDGRRSAMINWEERGAVEQVVSSCWFRGLPLAMALRYRVVVVRWCRGFQAILGGNQANATRSQHALKSVSERMRVYV